MGVRLGGGYHPSDDTLPMWLKAIIAAVIVAATLAVSIRFDNDRIMQPATPTSTTECYLECGTED